MRHHAGVSVWAIVVAGGSGERFGGSKLLMPLGDRRVVDVAIATAVESCDGVVVVVPAEAEWDLGAVITVTGGATRSASVRCGLAAVPGDATVVVVHDAARPLADRELFGAVIRAVRNGADGAVPALAIADTVKRVRDHVVIETVPRENLVTVQTPQAFRATALRAAHAAEPEATDDAGAIEMAGGAVVIVSGRPENVKITTAQDLAWVESEWQRQERSR